MTNETKPDGGPAFPCEVGPEANGYTVQTGNAQWLQPGMTKREYAAIQLKVPDSGTEWLDAMIRTAQRNELAARAMQDFRANRGSVLFADAAFEAHRMADAMLEQGDKT